MITQELTQEEKVKYILRSNPSIYSLRYQDMINGEVIFTQPSESAMRQVTEDLELFEKRQEAIYNRTRIAEGDWVQLRNGEYSRITVGQWSDSVQIGGTANGSYYINRNGHCSYSGGCGDSIKAEELSSTNEYIIGNCWIFSGDSSGAHRGVNLPLMFKVWKQI